MKETPIPGRFNRRAHGELGQVPPAEREADYYARHRASTTDQTPTLT